MISRYSENLFKKIISLSNNDNWQEAVLEWEVVEVEEDDNGQAECICGKENIRYMFTIRNVINGNILFPIGSSCIRKFNRDDLNQLASIKEKLFKLYHAIERNELVFLGLRNI